MSDWGFQNANPIVNFSVTVELQSAIGPVALAGLAAQHSRFKRELPRRLEQPMFFFPGVGAPIIPQRGQAAALSFDSVNADGSIARSLTVGPSQISYMTASYTRWKEIKPVIERMFSETLELIGIRLVATAVTFAVNNRFTWAGSADDASLASLLNDGCKKFAPNILNERKHCHSFHGYVDRGLVSNQSEVIRNVNIQTGDEDGNRVALISFSHRCIFQEPIEISQELFYASDNITSAGMQLLDELHDDNNKLFTDVVCLRLSRRMPGL